MAPISEPERWYPVVNSLSLAGHDADHNVPTVLEDGIDIGAGRKSPGEGQIVARQGSGE